MLFYPHAKINLSLYITGRRPDGYHELDTVFLPLAFFDELSVEPAEVFSFFCSDPALGGENNLVCRAYELLRKKNGLPPVTVRLTKHIPQQAGLGGGSADAAAMLAGLNRLFQLALSDSELMELGAQLGADVPALLLDCPTRGHGTGTELRPLLLGKRLSFLLLQPPLALSTAAMYAGWDRRNEEQSVAAAFSATEGGARLPMIRSRQKHLEKALAEGDVMRTAALCVNDFERILTGEDAHLIGFAKERLLAEGARAACLTGSGSAVFGLFDDAKKRDAARTRLAAKLPEAWQLFACESLSGGEQDE